MRQRIAGLIDLIAGHDARHRVILGSAAGAAVFLSLRNHVRLSTDAIAAWDAFAFFVLTSAWLTIVITQQQKLRARAQEQDFPRTVLFVFIVVLACAALFAVGFLVKVGRSEMRGHFTEHLLLGLATVVLSWSLLHTVFGLRYAHAFYGDSDQPGESLHAGGLVFPGKRRPDYFDFAYYSFVVGMTCQVSDVQITSYRMRRQKSADSPRRRQSAGSACRSLAGEKSAQRSSRRRFCDASPFALLWYTKPQDAV